MDENARSNAIKQARAMEKAGQIKSAYQMYVRVGAVQEAARLLANHGKSDEAGLLILKSLKVDANAVSTLDSKKRKLAYLAATYLAKNKKTASIAAEIFLNLGENYRAADALERAGDMVGAQKAREGKLLSSGVSPHPGGPSPGRAIGGAAVSRMAAERLEKEGKVDLAVKAYCGLKMYGEAGRILKAAKRPGEAANMFANGGMPFESAMCYLEAGDTGKGLDNLIRVPRSDRRYRAAVLEAIKLANELNVLSFQFEHFITEFVNTGPADENELDIFYTLADMYERHNLLTNAKEALNKVVAKNPNYKDAAKKLETLEQMTKGSAAVYEKIREEERAFKGDHLKGAPAARQAETTGLPGLPDLPDLPPPPKITGMNLTADGKPGTVVGAAMDATMAIPGANVPGNAQGTIAVPGAAPAANTPAAPEPEDPGFVVGNTIADRYRLDGELGQGGMAIVFKAHDLELEEDIALKVFLQQVLDPKMQKESLGRFKQELKLSRQLNHPNVIRLYDIGFHYGHRYISMELLKGSVLEDLLYENMGFARGISYLIQACAGLQAAHDKGVIHRDIKPDNLFITSDETVKVMDFGIAKNTYGKGLTVAGMTAGTPEYIAPEQISGFSSVTGAADMYALGVIAYRMFTSELVFEHEELTPLLMMHLQKEPIPPRHLNKEIPEELEKIILKLLAKKPEQRYASCSELAQNLKKVLTSLK